MGDFAQESRRASDAAAPAGRIPAEASELQVIGMTRADPGSRRIGATRIT